MSLIKCPECKHEVSEYEKICPACGFDIGEWIEKVSFVDDFLYDVEQVVDYKVENFINDMNPRLHAKMINGSFILSIYEECTLENAEYGIKWFLIQNQYSGFFEKDCISVQGFLMEPTDDGEDKPIRLKREQVQYIKKLLPKSNLIKKSELITFIIQLSELFENIYKVSTEVRVPWIEEKKEDGTSRYVLEIPKESQENAPLFSIGRTRSQELARVEYENGLYYLFLQDGYHDSKQIIVYESEIFYLFRGWGIDTTKFAELRKNCRINIHGEYVYNNPYLEALNYSSANEYAESKKDSYDSYTEAFLFWEKCNTLIESPKVAV